MKMSRLSRRSHRSLTREVARTRRTHERVQRWVMTSVGRAGMSGYRKARWILGVALIGAVAVVVPVPTPAHAATYVVNDTRDRVDSRPGNGVCRTSSGTCSLRAAVQEANARSGADVITLRSGTYTITRAPTNDNDITTGDLDITGPLTINGAGRAVTIVDGGTEPAGSDAARTALDRLFEIHAGAGDVTITGLTVREGWDAKEGGAIASRTAGTLRLADVAVIDSVSGNVGGGIHVDGFNGGAIALERVTISGNSASGEGGGIHLASGRLTINGTSSAPSTITGNTARNGGGIFNGGLSNSAGQPARVAASHATITANTALGDGGGIANQLEGVVSLSDSNVSGNTAGGDGGGLASSSKSSLAVVRTTFASNHTDANGGGMFAHTEGEVSISASSFSHNSSGDVLVPDVAGDGGGGLAVAGSGAVSISTSGFDGNTSAGDGGGLAIHSDGPVTLTDLHVSANLSLGSGAGILASGRVVDIVLVSVVGNVAADHGGGIDNQGSGEFSRSEEHTSE